MKNSTNNMSFILTLTTLLILVSQASFAQQIWTSKTSYSAGETVIVHYSGMPGHPSDWVTVTEASEPDSEWGKYTTTNGQKQGTHQVEGLSPGTYEARAFFNGINTVQKRYTFYINGSGTASPNSGTKTPKVTTTGEVATVPINNPRLWTNKNTFRHGETVTVHFSGMSGASNNWITVIDAAAPITQNGNWDYIGSQRKGTQTFDNLPPGNYEARAYFDGNYTLRARHSFSIVARGNSTTTGQVSTVGYNNTRVRTNKLHYISGEPITVSFSGMSGASNDWIAITKASKPVNTYDTYQYTSGRSEGQLTFSNDLQPGHYEVRVYFNNSYQLKAKSSFSVNKN